MTRHFAATKTELGVQKSGDTKKRAKSPLFFCIFYTLAVFVLAAHRRLQMGFVLTALALVTFATWSVTLRGEFVDWDDTHLILRNPRISHFSPKIFTTFDPELYEPLVLFSYQVEHALFGFDPFFFHLDALLLHILNVLLVFFLLRFFFRAPSVSFFGALLFAVHPLHAEAIAWATARKELLFTSFFLLSLLAYLRSKKGLSLFFFLGSLLSKVTGVGLPFLLLLYELRERKNSLQNALKVLVPFFALSMIFLVVGAIGQRQSVFGLSLLNFLLLAGARVVFALEKFFLPFHLAPLYPAPPITLLSARYLLPIILIPAVFVLIFRFFRRNHTALFGGTLFLLTLGPSLLSYVQADTVMLGADRYMYLPSVGVILFLGSVILPLLEEKNLRRVLAIIVTGIILVFCVLARAQARIWATSETLFQHLIREEPELHIAWNNLGFVYLSRKEHEKALPYFLKALELEPNYPDALLNVAAVYVKRGDLDEAERSIRESIRLAPNRPLGHFNLGGIHFLREEWDEAIQKYKIVLQIDPFMTRAAIQLARSYLGKGDRASATAAYRRALEMDPTVRGTMEELDALIP